MHCAEAGKALIKFNHCEKYIYSLSVPQYCPLCQQDLGSRKLEDAPVSIANPFTNGHQEKCSFLLRPTQGTFLSAHGVQRDGAGWEQSISIPLLQPNMYGMMEQWDKYLEDFSTSGAWLPHRYEEDHHNCYTYTLTFINCVLMAEGRQQLDKGEFTEKYVVPRTRLASKFITLYRAIREHGFYVTDCPRQEVQPPEGGGLY
ncbi:MKRN2 opposite strand protein isoform X3 [Symphalangus syndactylus]|uniref:MKRN2 opposite strand protein isoform X3 n=1 Tax=Symphalangus syndactylus TaxID=9590 RepID=UPI00244270FA|nr:MKRN2 opposite strand protein isoform X2 [Symphalangus syndactylus]